MWCVVRAGKSDAIAYMDLSKLPEFEVLNTEQWRELSSRLPEGEAPWVRARRASLLLSYGLAQRCISELDQAGDVVDPSWRSFAEVVRAAAHAQLGMVATPKK